MAVIPIRHRRKEISCVCKKSRIPAQGGQACGILPAKALRMIRGMTET